MEKDSKSGNEKNKKSEKNEEQKRYLLNSEIIHHSEWDFHHTALMPQEKSSLFTHFFLHSWRVTTNYIEFSASCNILQKLSTPREKLYKFSFNVQFFHKIRFSLVFVIFYYALWWIRIIVLTLNKILKVNIEIVHCFSIVLQTHYQIIMKLNLNCNRIQWVFCFFHKF